LEEMASQKKKFGRNGKMFVAENRDWGERRR
jgi:hypothetical protein